MLKNELMEKMKRCMPATGNYLKEGLRFAILNTIILIVGSGTGLGILWIVNLARRAGFPIPLPIWLIMLGIGIPCFIIWFKYGNAFGALIRERYVIRGMTVALLGDIPGLGGLHLLMNMPSDFLISWEIQRITLILLVMIVIMMPTMTVLGVLDKKKAGT